MDHLVLRTRPDADSADVTAHAMRILNNFLTCAAALGVVVPDREDGAHPGDAQEVWAQADRCLVEAYSRTLCANSGAASDSLSDACRAAFQLEAALRKEQSNEVVLCTSPR